ncbi:transglutaminase family protein [Polaromonas sp.]|uniref:transglutaminase family protein n=1 Tax=Polaromonas sp. TaxID=1869339 RepID=UPI002CF8FBAA|nr:transglutaminase family protein [Polaromonas sp.]HQS30255.1 transglutaminase family protein [Polaromonas sp.]HQS92525.1 transglutaminase family protein [Polaromonas sp.]
MLLRVVHETSYRYRPAVDTAHHVVHLKPASLDGQTLQHYALQIEPPPAMLREELDVYGNARTSFSFQSAHERLTVVAESIVRTTAAPRERDAELAPQLNVPWEQVRERFRYRAGAAYDSASEFLFASPYVPRDDAFAEFARAVFTPGRPLLEAAEALMTHIHTHMTFESESTEVSTPALEALKQGKGVCQDFAHIMVACCRALGLPARYVSGYLLTSPPPGRARLIGSDASHAWASMYFPGDGVQGGRWLDFDPTNNRAPGEDYVRLATGRDFLDVSPMRGVIRGGSRHQLDVAVTVEPMEPMEPMEPAGLT